MKKILLVTILSFSCALFNSTHAQTDSTHFDLGRTLLNKSLTQSITVKGVDLEKQPFANIAEAINVWFYGSLTYKDNLVYIIDGSIANDVNAYSVFDIEEVTLVQNAQTIINTSSPFQQAILITTKRNNNGKGGLIVAGQTNMIGNYKRPYSGWYPNSSFDDATIKSGLYHNYNISGYKNTGKIRAGLSAGIMRDMIPEISRPALSNRDVSSLTRFRFNGYINANIGSRSVLDFALGYAPQNTRFSAEGTDHPQFEIYNYKDEQRSSGKLFNASLKFKTKISSSLVNMLHIGYNNLTNNNHRDVFHQYNQTGQTNTYTSTYNEYKNTSLINIYDRISYIKRAGDFAIEATVNFNYRHIKDSSASTHTNVSYDRAWYKRNALLLTPSIAFFYKDVVGLQGGVLYNTTAPKATFNYKAKPIRLYPFINISADITRAIDSASKVSVKIYGSYAASNNFNDVQNTLNDLSYIRFADGLMSTDSQLFTAEKPDKAYTAGLSISPRSNIFTLSYFFEKRDFKTFYWFPAPSGGLYPSIININSRLHTVSLSAKVVGTSSFAWRSMINATNLRQRYNLGMLREVTGNKIWTGGWANRITAGNLFAGVDLLYRFGKGMILVEESPLINDVIEDNSFSVQNIFLGYKLKNIELFANARNLYQNEKSTITDYRKYYGLGFKLEL